MVDCETGSDLWDIADIADIAEAATTVPPELLAVRYALLPCCFTRCRPLRVYFCSPADRWRYDACNESRIYSFVPIETGRLCLIPASANGPEHPLSAANISHRSKTAEFLNWDAHSGFLDHFETRNGRPSKLRDCAEQQ